MSFEVQADIRRQALELQDSMKELQKFTEQAKKKDAALKAAAELRAKAMSGIPPRSQVHASSGHHVSTTSFMLVGHAVVDQDIHADNLSDAWFDTRV